MVLPPASPTPPIPERVLAQEGEVPVQVYRQIVRGGGGADAIFVGEEADAREPIQETTTTSAPPHVVGLQSSSSSQSKSTASDVN